MAQSFVNFDALREESTQELQRAVREDAMPAELYDAMRQELHRREALQARVDRPAAERIAELHEEAGVLDPSDYAMELCDQDVDAGRYEGCSSELDMAASEYIAAGERFNLALQQEEQAEARTFCHTHEAGACYAGCPDAYALADLSETQRQQEASRLLRRIADLESDEGGKGYALGMLSRVKEPGFASARYIVQLWEGVLRRLEEQAQEEEPESFDSDADEGDEPERNLEELLSEMFEEMAPDFEANTFEHTGVLTNNRGLLVRDPASGHEWQITIVRSA